MFKAYARGLRDGARRSWRHATRRWSATPVDGQQIREALATLSAAPPPVVLVHSSLSACGHVRGGALTVIDALRSWTSGATLAMPSHAYRYPTAAGAGPVFDPAHTPSVVGAVTDVFWRQPGVLRSLHPTHSLAAEGPLARALITGHETCDTPCGRGTPYERLVDQDSGVLMFGATLDGYTLFHTAEDAGGAPYLYEPRPVALRYLGPDSVVREMTMRRHDMRVARRFEQTAPWLEARGLLRRLPLGDGQLLWVEHAGRAHAALVTQLRLDPWFLTKSAA